MDGQAAGVVIVGAGQAGAAAAVALRQQGYAERIVMLGEEPYLPYHRPPLSKEWLTGAASLDRLLLRPASFYASQRIQVRTGARVFGLDTVQRRLALSNGEVLHYDKLVLATGASPAWPPISGCDLRGVLALRGLQDAEHLRAAFRLAGRLLIVGGGYVGLEVAASARQCGLKVTIAERADRVLARVASQPLSTWFERLHRSRGVTILTQRTVREITGTDGCATGVVLADGERLACDLVLVAAGAAANDLLARDAGLACSGGILVDAACCTSARDVYAIGDCAVVDAGGRRSRLESVPNATEQAKRVAAAIGGRPLPPPEVPWFWSDQYEFKLQMAGACDGGATQVLRGDTSSGKFALFHLRADQTLAGVESVGDSVSFMAGKSFIAKGAVLDPERLADLQSPLPSAIREPIPT